MRVIFYLIASGNALITKLQFKMLWKTFEHPKETSEQSLGFTSIYMGMLRMVVVTNVSFVNAIKMNIQLELVALAVHPQGTEISYSTGQTDAIVSRDLSCRLRFTRLYFGFDYGYVVCDTVEKLLG